MDETHVERRLAAILVADIVEYSRLMAEDEAATVATLKGHQAVVLPMVEAHGGRIQDTAGDGILAEFRSVQQAVECAIAIQRTMAERNAAVPPARQMRFRIGVNFGDVMYDGTRVYGDGLNVAARVQEFAAPGGICVTAMVREEVGARTSLAFEDLGAQSLKNIPRPVRVFRVRLDDQSKLGTTPRAALGDTIRAWRRAVLIGILVVACIGALGLGVRLAIKRGQPVDRPRLSIAVLPFSNLSGDPGQDYFSDGLTEDLTTDLSRIEGAFVIARNTMQSYRGKTVDVKQLGRELGVRYVLEGSVRRAERQVRVNAQLIDAETGAHLWAERFDRSAEDLFSFQNEVTGQIARTLHLQLKEAESQRATRGRPEHLEAVDYARKAWAELWNKPPARETNDQAFAYLDKALALDPQVPEIWTNLSYAHTRAAVARWSTSRSAIAATGPRGWGAGGDARAPERGRPLRPGLRDPGAGRHRQGARRERDGGDTEPEPRTGACRDRHMLDHAWAPAGSAALLRPRVPTEPTRSPARRLAHVDRRGPYDAGRRPQGPRAGQAVSSGESEVRRGLHTASGRLSAPRSGGRSTCGPGYSPADRPAHHDHRDQGGHAVRLP